MQSADTTRLPRTTTAQLRQHGVEPGRDAGGTVRLCGWIHRRRKLSGLTFVVLRDRTGTAQIVVHDENTRAQVDNLSEETAVEVVGRPSVNPRAPGGIEVTDPAFTPLTDPAATPPFEVWRPAMTPSLPTFLDNAQIGWRHPRQAALWHVAAAAMRGFRDTLTASGFTEIQTPKLVASATESGANVFEVDYFGRPAYLAQSPQFYKQICVGAFERVFEVGPVFRAEPHDTVRHLAEYVSLDVEVGFISDHRDVLAVLRNVLAGMLAGIATHAGDAVAALDIVMPAIPAEIPVIHFTEALRIAGASPDEPDLAPADERAVGAWANETFGSDVVAVEGYPMMKRPFYTHPQPDEPSWSRSFDLLFRGVELVTGGQRLHRYGDYVDALAARGELDGTGQVPAAYRSYLETFRHGMPPHGGFAIGLERFTSRLAGADNVRWVTLFPRDLHRLTP